MTKSALESLNMARDLIQEAKGADGPKGGFVTDHLDSAENWLDKVEEFINNPTRDAPKSYIVVGRELNREEYLDCAMMATLDHTHSGDGMGSFPALTILLYKVCDNNPQKFEEACRLITLIQAKTLDLIDQ